MLGLLDQSVQTIKEQVRYQDFDIISMSGPGFYTQEIFNYLNDPANDKERIVIVPPHVFYPISNQNRDSLTFENFL